MKSIKGRLFFSFVMILGFSGVLLCRLLFIQLVETGKFQALVRKQVQESRNVSLSRGLILDRNQKIMAMNKRSISVAANPGIIENKDEFSEIVSRKFGLPREEILEKLSRNSHFVWLKRKISVEDINGIDKMNLEGLIVQEEPKRYYHYGDIASHVVGAVGMDGNGLSGIEYMYDVYFQKKQVAETIIKDGLHRKIEISSGRESESVNVVLSLDTGLQYIASRQLEDIVKTYSPKKAFVIIQNPNNGEILAMVSTPGFDPENYDFTQKDLLNPAIHDVFEPGSTLKLITAAAAITECRYKLNDIINCENGSYKYYDIEINDHEKYGCLSFEGIMAYSSNIGFAKVGVKVGRDNMYNWMKKFGLGSYTGIDLSGEEEGLIYKPYSKKWSMVTLPTISYGQGVGVTGLQLINAYSAIANGGTLYEPYIIKSVTDENNNELWQRKPTAIREVVSPETSDKLKDMLQAVVDYGTGKLAAVKGYQVCGKTGTAQKIDPATRQYSSREYIASFCGFLPAEKPAVTILIVVDTPLSNYWASNVACPAFSRIAESTMNYLNMAEKNRDNVPKKGKGSYDFTKATPREY